MTDEAAREAARKAHKQVQGLRDAYASLPPNRVPDASEQVDDREPFREARAAGKAASQAKRLAHADLAIVRQALDLLPDACRYHGRDLMRGYGLDRYGPCCETGKPAVMRHAAEAALKRLEANL